MKTKELMNSLKRRGYRYERVNFIGSGLGLRIINKEYSAVAVINTDKIRALDTRFPSFYELSEEKQDDLYNLLDEYARTPMEDREPLKKYRYRFIPNITFDYPDCHIARRVQFLSGEEVLQLDTSKEETAERRPEYHFTDKEVEQYTGKDRKLFELCEKIEVSDE